MHDFPLFPLDLVALPHELIPLHIFEERFKTTAYPLSEAGWESRDIWGSPYLARDAVWAKVAPKARDGKT